MFSLKPTFRVLKDEEIQQLGTVVTALAASYLRFGID
jgi:hypothetical protein